MSIDTEVLKAMLRLARRRQEASEDQVALRVRAQAREVRASLRRLRASGLVDVQNRAAPRLTIEGLALAVAVVSRPSPRAGAVAIRSRRAA
jgi:Mn-dependent DtxR family transcriptional regulator